MNESNDLCWLYGDGNAADGDGNADILILMSLMS